MAFNLNAAIAAAANPRLPETHPFVMDFHALLLTEGALFAYAGSVVAAVLIAKAVRRRRSGKPAARARSVIRPLLSTLSLCGIAAVALQFVPWYQETTASQSAWTANVSAWLRDDYGLDASSEDLDAAAHSRPFTINVAGEPIAVRLGATPDGNLALVNSANVLVPPVKP